MVWSPWVHVTGNAAEEYQRYDNAEGDALTGALLQWGAEAYFPAMEDQQFREALPYICPLHHPFELKTSLWVHAGKGEAFYDSIKSFSQEMAERNGKRVRFHATDLAPHGLVLGHKSYGMTPGLQVAADDAAKFFEESN